MSINGKVEIQVADEKDETTNKCVRIRRAHLEEDAGKSMHDEVAGKADSRVDLNRCGTPLLEIVTEPDLRSADEAREFLRQLKLILTYVEVSDCNMQEGSLRVDANVNLHIPVDGETVATPIVEIKNLNSFRAVERALLHEADRQYRRWQQTGETSGDVPKQTRGWNDQQGVTVAQRSKEESSDYRYFPDPDLVPVTLTDEQINNVRARLGKLPAEVRHELESTHGLSSYDADVIVNQGKRVVDYFESVVQICGDAKQASNWIQRDVLRWLNDSGSEIADYPVTPNGIAELIKMTAANQLDSSRAREVLAEMVTSGSDLKAAMQAMGVQQLDDSEIETLCSELLAANPQVVADVQAGKERQSVR